MQTQDVVQVPIVDVRLLVLFLYVCTFDQFDVDLRAFFQAVMLQ